MKWWHCYIREQCPNIFYLDWFGSKAISGPISLFIKKNSVFNSGWIEQKNPKWGWWKWWLVIGVEQVTMQWPISTKKAECALLLVKFCHWKIFQLAYQISVIWSTTTSQKFFDNERAGRNCLWTLSLNQAMEVYVHSSSSLRI